MPVPPGYLCLLSGHTQGTVQMPDSAVEAPTQDIWVMGIASISQTPRGPVPGPEPWCLIPNPASYAPLLPWIFAPLLPGLLTHLDTSWAAALGRALCEESSPTKESSGLPFLLPSQERPGCPGTSSGPGASLPVLRGRTREPQVAPITGNLPRACGQFFCAEMSHCSPGEQWRRQGRAGQVS